MIYGRHDFELVLRTKKPWPWKRKVIAAMTVENQMANNSRRSRNRRKPRNFHRNRGFALDEMSRLSDTLFRRMFRVTRDAFNALVVSIDPLIARNVEKAMNSSGSHISTKTRLAVTLRWLAGGHQIDLCFAWGIGKLYSAYE